MGHGHRARRRRGQPWPRLGRPLLADPPHLLRLPQVLQLLPLEDLCGSKEGFPGDLQDGRCWEMAKGPEEGDLWDLFLGRSRPYASPVWMCFSQSVWGSPGDSHRGEGPRLEAVASNICGDSWEASGDARVQPLRPGAAAKPCWGKQGRCWKWLCQLPCPCSCWFCRNSPHGLGWGSAASSPCPDAWNPREASVPSPDPPSPMPPCLCSAVKSVLWPRWGPGCSGQRGA